MNRSKVGRLMMLLLLLALPMMVVAQTTIRGVVKDQSGQPLPGVNVTVAGTTNGTVTDMDGNYSISAPADATLNFSFIGFTSRSEQVNGRTSIDVDLQDESHDVDEVVVVGYGQMKKSDLTGSVTSVGADAIKKSVITSVDQVLQGRAAGVQIQANSGTPGASSSIRIRGVNSLNATNQPIFVIDGVVVDSDTDDETSNPLSSINPSDIVSMDVLKDASATAIYGSRASNGVIMITTRKGKAGEATVTYDGYVGWQEMPVEIEMLNLQEYAIHHNTRADLGLVDHSSAFVRPDLLGKGTNWQEELFRKAFMHSHNLSVSGGNEGVTYAFSIGYLDQDGIALESSFLRQSIRGSIDSNAKKYLHGGISFSFTESKQNVGTDNNTIMDALIQQPTVAVTSPDGSFDGPDDMWMPDNPVGLATIKTNKNRKDNFRINYYLEAIFLKDFKLKTELSTDYNLTKAYYYQPDYQFGTKTNDIRTSTWTKTDTKYWSWRNILTYDHLFNNQHNLSIMIGQEMSHSNWEQQKGSATGFLTNSTPDLSAGGTTETTGTKNESSIASVFGRIFYSFADRYLITATIREDGSSKFAKGNKWGTFPSAAFAWRISQESFLRDNNVLSNLKLRLGWGATGNQNVENDAYKAMLAYKTTPGDVVGVLTANTANPDLTWETTNSYNVGVDVGFLDNRLELVADLYYKKTKNLLLQLPLPAYAGSYGFGAASNPWGNVGSIRNQGFELTINTTNFDREHFHWTTNFVFSLNRNKVMSLDTESSTIDKTFQPSSDPYIVTRTEVGQPVAQFYGYKVIGRFDKAEDFYYKDKDGNIQPVALPKGNTIARSSTWIGDYIFQDTNGDGEITAEDMVYIGNPEPKFTYGLGNTFTFFGVDVNLFLSGSYGNMALDLTRYRIEDPRQNSNITKKAYKNYARVEVINPDLPDDDYRNLRVSNTKTSMPAVQASDANANYTRVSDVLIEDASYLRIQNISVGYTFMHKWMEKIKMQTIRVYGNIQNVYTFTKYEGMDPEIGAMYGDALMTGLDYGRYPSPRIYTIGLNVQF